MTLKGDDNGEIMVMIIVKHNGWIYLLKCNALAITPEGERTCGNTIKCGRIDKLFKFSRNIFEFCYCKK